MVKIIDPLFFQAIEKLKEEKPRNYSIREIDLYNDGKDALQQEIKITGNMLQVLDFPEFCDIKIQINEPTNEAITLQKGIILFNFYRFFLTYEHIPEPINQYYKKDLLKLLISKDLIFVNEPTLIQKPFSKIVVSETFPIKHNEGRRLDCRNASKYNLCFDVTGFNQVRGIVIDSMIGGTKERTLLIRQPTSVSMMLGEFLTTEIKFPPQFVGTSFFVDLVGEKIQFYGCSDDVENYSLRLWATLWCL